MENIKKLFSQSIPHIIAIVIFVIITLIYFNPVTKGKVLKQDDISRFLGMSKEIVDHREATGEEALWTNSMFGGMPAFQISVMYTANQVKKINKALYLGIPYPISIVFLYFLGFYILLVTLRVNPWLSIAGAIFFGFSSYFFIILQAGHNSKAHAIAYIAPVVAGVLLTYRGKYLLGGVLTALALALQLNANHLQITYYLIFILLIFGITKFIYSVKEKTLPSFIKASVVMVIALVFAVGPNLSSIWSTYEYGKYTTRGKSDLTINPDGSTNEEDKTSGLDMSYATAWSYGVGETMTLLIPSYEGSSSHASLTEDSETYKTMLDNGVPKNQAKEYLQYLPMYHGAQPFTSGPVYAGALICFLFVFGLMVVRKEYRWWLLAATIFSIVLAWGKNFPGFTNFFLENVPGYNKFRTVSMILVIAEFTLPLMAILAIQEVLVTRSFTDKKLVSKYLYIAFALTGGVSLIIAAMAGSIDISAASDASLQGRFPEWMIDSIMEDRTGMIRSDALRSFGFILIAAAALWIGINKKIRKEYIFATIILLAVIDMWPVNNRFINNEKVKGSYLYWQNKKKSKEPYQMNQADKIIKEDKDPNFRVFNLTERFDQDARTSYFHKNIGGYHGAKLKRIQEMIDFHLYKEQRILANALSDNPTMASVDSALARLHVSNMLNSKYFVINPNGAPIQNRHALGNAWFVTEHKIVEDADEEILALNNFEPTKTVIVDKRFEQSLAGYNYKYDSLSYIKLDEYKPNLLKYSCSAKTDQLAVFSEIYYPAGWNAFIDGKETEYIRGNYLLRVVKIPAGDHTLEFRFEPRSYYAGENVALISSILLILAFIGIVVKELRSFLIAKGEKGQLAEEK